MFCQCVVKSVLFSLLFLWQPWYFPQRNFRVQIFFYKFQRTYIIIKYKIPNLKFTRYHKKNYNSNIPAFFKENNYYFGKNITEHLFSNNDLERSRKNYDITDDRDFVDKIKVQQNTVKKVIEKVIKNSVKLKLNLTFEWMEKLQNKNYDKRLDVFNRPTEWKIKFRFCGLITF